MTDLMIHTNRRFETAKVQALTGAGRMWLNENYVMVVDGCVTMSLDGAVELELAAERAGLTTCGR